MTRRTFRRNLTIGIWLTPIWFALSVIFLGNFIVEGGPVDRSPPDQRDARVGGFFTAV